MPNSSDKPAHETGAQAAPAAETDAGAQRIATAVADRVVARAAEAEAAALPVTGSFTLEVEYNEKIYSLLVNGPTPENGNSWVVEIEYNEVVYRLAVRPPSDEDTGWSFSLVRVSDGEDYVIAEFEYVDSATWRLKFGLPGTVTLGSFKILQLSLELQRGELPGPPELVEAPQTFESPKPAELPAAR
jgi:hypothetical protein